MSNEFNITVPSTVTLLGQNEATLEAAPADPSKNSAKRASMPAGINPIAPAKQPKAANFTFPITGGIVTTRT